MHSRATGDRALVAQSIGSLTARLHGNRRRSGAPARDSNVSRCIVGGFQHDSCCAALPSSYVLQSPPECAGVRPSGLASCGVACTLAFIAYLVFNMAWEHITLVRQVPLQYIAKLILFALASRVDDEGKCWPSIDTICHDTGLKRRTTQIHLKSLVESGYVIRQERPGRTALLWINMRMLATGVCETAPHDLHRGVHALQESGAGHAPEVEIEQPINRQVRKLSTKAKPVASTTAPTRWWATPAGIDAKGRELQVLARPGEGYAAYKDRLLAIERQRCEPP